MKAVIHEPQSKQTQMLHHLPAEPPPPQLSWFRVGLLLVVIAGIAAGAWALITHAGAVADADSNAVPVYAPYVDATLAPTYQFQLAADNPVSSVYLGFIVSDPSSACTPSWGGYYTLAQADQSIELGARIAQLQKQGGAAAVSFGGRENNELAVSCTDPAALRQAYLAPIERYHVNTIDFDIEGAALSDQAANLRRAAAVAAVEQLLAKSHRKLRVWMTLPVSEQGLTAQGVAAVRAMLAAHVTLAGVNALAMDFGPGQGAASNLFATVRRALFATHAQVESIWHLSGLRSTAGSAWEHLGATVMLGVNDITDEHFTVADAHELAAFANREGLPRVSAWSLNRDSECGSTFPEVGLVSNTCSGVLQSSLEFTDIFSKLRGTKTARAESPVSVPLAQSGVTTEADNPAESPYPIW